MRPLGRGLSEVDVVFRNEGAIPTRTARAFQKKIGSADVCSLAGEGLVVESAGVVVEATNRVEDPQLRRPAALRLPRGIPGDGAVRVRFVVHGTGRARVTFRAEKGGTAALDVEIR